jgi:N utilization substance protein B
MITRRSVRIKAMQYIYAFETTQPAPASYFEKHLENSILSVRDQYLYILLYIREVANFVEKDAKIKASKFIKKDSDKNFNTKLLSNIIIQYLNNDTEFQKEIKNANIAALLDEDNIRQIYKKLTESEEYANYLNNGSEFNLEEDRSIVNYLLNYLILEDEVFTANTEEHFTNWMDDAEFVIEAVHEVIQKSKNELKLHIDKSSLQEKFKELTQFGLDLFNKTIEHKKEHQQMIEPKLRNWETDRLAVVDVILIRMAVSEFLYFESIPVKVTINEYLDIAKEYSTPKSKDFINGVLDSLMRDMRQNDQLQKTGRGLL